MQATLRYELFGSEGVSDQTHRAFQEESDWRACSLGSRLP